jgi:hypothetical protein
MPVLGAVEGRVTGCVDEASAAALGATAIGCGAGVGARAGSGAAAIGSGDAAGAEGGGGAAAGADGGAIST